MADQPGEEARRRILDALDETWWHEPPRYMENTTYWLPADRLFAMRYTELARAWAAEHAKDRPEDAG